ncbi:hypothetical protein M595_1212 [Lyngbya aestuarii BL J]|uniref:Uncharacterized protein n=1 Tax=Lyngbya aestuarii BL J TaxID=1348334 RepID=U7QQI4_9CYAN|nr:hypothetical protein [Lyngbya aestuarii]ERT08681.1 hypothetical protein M595_1212 [Lyngbya aestuarii BL J]
MNEGQWIEVGGIPRFIPDNSLSPEEVEESEEMLEGELLINLSEEYLEF